MLLDIMKYKTQDMNFKANELCYQGNSKQNARQNPSFRANECVVKQNERQDMAFKAHELS